MINGKPVICLTNDSSACEDPQGLRPRQLVSPKAYSAAVAAAGGVPLLTGEFCPDELAALSDGLLLTGGDDIDPELFGETVLNATVSLDPARTAFEVPLARAFLAQGKPILTICRGVQLLNCLMGGDVYQDLPEQVGVIHGSKTLRHPVRTAEGSLLFRLFGPEFRVNSTHHQAIRKVAPGFRVTAVSLDGVVEAVEHESLPIFGVQFHPERLTGPLRDARTPDFAPFFAHYIGLVRADAQRRGA